MDFAATHSVVEPGRKRRTTPFVVVIVGEVFDAASHPLFPVAPAEGLPFALLPICNTPIIDYLLENLARNGASEIYILLNSESVTPVCQHLQGNRTACNEPGQKGTEFKVEVVASTRKMTRLFDATTQILEQNIVQQNSSFLFVPIEAVASMRNLSDLFETHLQRATTIKNYAATMLCASVKPLLEDTLHDVLVGELNKQERATSNALLERDPASFVGVDIRAVDRRPHMAPECLPSHVTMFALEKSTGVVRNMVRLEQDEVTEPMKVCFSVKENLSLRTDLVPTGYFFCSAGALSLFTFHTVDQHGFFVSLLASQELFGNVFGIQAVAAPMDIIQPINSLRSYIQVNIDVCFRRFFPLTRESSFAGDGCRYAVSPHCQSVYLHQKKAEVLSNTCGPCVVVGEQAVVSPTTVVRGSVLGKGVRIGEGSTIIGCVLLDGTVVGRGCFLSRSLFGYNVVVNDKAEVSNCIVGHGSTIGVVPHCNCVGDGSSPAQGVVLQDRVISNGRLARREEGMTKDGDDGGAVQLRQVSSIVPTRELFVRDPVPCETGEDSDDDDDDDDDDDEKMAGFKEAVAELVRQALHDPSHMSHCILQMKNTRLSFRCNNSDLCFIVTEQLLAHVLATHAHSSDPIAAIEAVSSLLGRWCHPFYMKMVTGIEEMQAILRATCTAIGDSNCLLHLRGPQLMECLYNGCDDELYDERGYCIVTGESLVEFGARMRRLAQEPPGLAEDDEEAAREEGMLRVALSCLGFIDGVRAFLEQEEDED
ncbi:translation initiation factor eIF-2B subunit epsilon [Trypanosoma conorhini]|uniref:Translation initiation factor eIF-2B subunit epsilon n=1 Tax=Trypanosoma conorhini TaxID=83891 RepID=A0A3S5ISU1_9TRYP|nr:translation initiation factor eIF-2B subunit epsilon [Trypanosoma conorhini]RNF13363.1 translation initiation factor eIF-2B subunit epsilon [Trypanosoma conorhini]